MDTIGNQGQNVINFIFKLPDLASDSLVGVTSQTRVFVAWDNCIVARTMVEQAHRRGSVYTITMVHMNASDDSNETIQQRIWIGAKVWLNIKIPMHGRNMKHKECFVVWC
jgi:aromatic ring-cleaving dioxygenase